MGAQTETELKEKKLRVEDALNATKAAVEEGIVIGGGCTLLRLAEEVDAIKLTLGDEEAKRQGGINEQQVGARRGWNYVFYCVLCRKVQTGPCFVSQ